MKKVIIILYTILFFTIPAIAQDEQAINPNNQQNRPKLMQELGLSTAQVQQIRQINQSQKPRLEFAQRKFRQARKALDEAIYAEEFDENDVQAKNKEVQIAQAAITRIKTETEVSIRKVLTPEQLVKFRELRVRLIQANQNKNRPILKQVRQFPNRQQ